MTVKAVLGILLAPFLVALPALALGPVQQAAGQVLEEDYGLYNRVVEAKFLTSQIQLVLLERTTVAWLVPSQEGSMTTAFFQQQGYFDGLLPQDLVQNFVGANHVRSRLEDRFQFGVRYRFVAGDASEVPEASTAVPVLDDHVMSAHAPSVVDRLAFSRVGRTPENDQALVYVENVRRDGTGAGFLVWFHRHGREWELFDTEVVWTIRSGEREADAP